jgi:hypothetical protein
MPETKCTNCRRSISNCTCARDGQDGGPGGGTVDSR